MKKNRFWIIISILSFLLSLFIKQESFQATFIETAIASILGHFLSLLTFPAIISLIIGGIYKIFGGKFDKSSFKWTFLMAWSILVFSNLTVYLRT